MYITHFLFLKFYVLCAANRCRGQRTTFRSSFSLSALLCGVGSLVSATVLCTPGWLVSVSHLLGVQGLHMAFYLGSRDLNLRHQAFRTVLFPTESFLQLYFVLIPRPPLWFYFICACGDYVTFSPCLPLCHSKQQW